MGSNPAGRAITCLLQALDSRPGPFRVPARAGSGLCGPAFVTDGPLDITLADETFTREMLLVLTPPCSA